MIRDQCKAYCQCSYCKQTKGHTGAKSDSLRLASGTGRSKDELYLRTLNESLRAKSLMASSRNAHKFKPDEMLQSTRGDMAKAALTVPVRRRDRLQELLILENKDRIKSERMLRRERRAMGLPDDMDEGCQDRAVGTHDDFPDTDVVSKAADVDMVTMPPACSAEEDLRSALQTIKNITEEHNAGDPNKALTSDHVYQLRQLVHNQDKKTKKMLADCPQQPHVCNHCFAVNVQGTHRCQVPPMHILQDSLLPSIHDQSSRRFKYNTHPYGTGVVWLPLDEEKKQQERRSVIDATPPAREKESSPGSDEADSEYQYPGSTHNTYLNGARAHEGAPVRDGLPATPDGHGAFVDSKGLDDTNNKGLQVSSAADKKKNGKESPLYKSSAALWRTTNQDRAAQMQRFLEFKKMQANASRVYAESAVRRPGNAADAIFAGDQNRP